jgi:hypothetical protein
LLRFWIALGNSPPLSSASTSRLPGEQGFRDARGTTLFPDLPGQSRDPIYNTTLPDGKE